MTNDTQPKPLPPALKALGSAFVIGHFIALGGLVLSADSGPWPTPFGESTSLGPWFARTLNLEAAYPYYLEPLRLTHNYHFFTNRVAQPEVKFEIKLYDRTGRVIETLAFPEKTANPWVRHRLQLLAANLYGDRRVFAPMGESSAPEGKFARKVKIWEPEKGSGGVQVMKDVPRHLVSRDRFVFGPSAWSKIVADSYVRFQCKLHNAAAGELIRRSKEAVQPSLLLLEDIPAAAFPENVVSFGKVTP